jgi:uncharacterized membrane protein (UPF0127 family)
MSDIRSRFLEVSESPVKLTAVVLCVVLAVAVMIIAGVVVLDTGPSGPVEVTFQNGTETVGSLSVEPASTETEMVTGLSEHTMLNRDEGMLFYHRQTGSQTYVMRNMSFGIDIVFIDERCTVTKVVSAPAPGANQTGLEPTHTYSGTAKYVLETQRGYAASRLSQGDSVTIEPPESAFSYLPGDHSC